MAWVWQDDEQPDRRMSLYDDPSQRARVGSYADALPDWMLQGPTAAAPRQLMQQPTETPSQGFNYNRFATIAGLAANALAPDSIGGRLGASAAQLGIHYEDQAYKERLEKERERQRMLRGLMSRSGPRGVYPGQDLVGPDPEGRYGLLYRSERTPRQLAPPPTALGSSRPAYGEYPSVEGQFSPRAQQLRPPPATALGASRPAYGDYPAVEGQFSPRQSMISLPPGYEAVGPTPEGTVGPLYQSKRTPVQAAPPATSRTASRPEYADPFTGDVYPAVGPLFTPREQAVTGAPGSTIIPAPGQAPIVAQPTARQSTISLTPGATAYRPGETRGLLTAPYSPAQKAVGATRGLRTVKPDEWVMDAQGNVVLKRPPSTAPSKSGKPTQFDKTVQTFRGQFERLKDIPAKPGRLWGEYPAHTAESQAQALIEAEKGTRRSAMEAAFQQVFYQEGDQSAAPTTPQRTPAKSADPLEGRTATGAGGKKLIRRNGQWVPYAP